MGTACQPEYWDRGVSYPILVLTDAMFHFVNGDYVFFNMDLSDPNLMRGDSCTSKHDYSKKTISRKPCFGLVMDASRFAVYRRRIYTNGDEFIALASVSYFMPWLCHNEFVVVPFGPLHIRTINLFYINSAVLATMTSVSLC